MQEFEDGFLPVNILGDPAASFAIKG